MISVDLSPFQLRRINPFQGLMIDSDVWRDAHEYHRNLMRLHQLALHGWGIVDGLSVGLAGENNTLVVQPGMAIDPAGNIVLVTQAYTHQLEAKEKGTAYLLVQFSEVPSGPLQPNNGGPGLPTRLVEAYRIHQRERLPDEPCVELARIEFDPSGQPIRLPKDAESPGANELDLRFRPSLGSLPAGGYGFAAAPAAALAPEIVITPSPVAASAPPVEEQPDPAPPPPPLVVAPPASIRCAIVAHGGPGWDSHLPGWEYVAREVQAATGRTIELIDSMKLAEAEGVDLLYLSGWGPLTLQDQDVAALERLLKGGSRVLAEGCVAGPDGEAGALQFARSYTELTLNLGRKLARVERGHPALQARHMFAELPPGMASTVVLLEDRGAFYSGADYGCAWQGGLRDKPQPRAVIRDATDLAVNLVTYAVASAKTR